MSELEHENAELRERRTGEDKDVPVVRVDDRAPVQSGR
jgi:hypothetical protein